MLFTTKDNATLTENANELYGKMIVDSENEWGKKMEEQPNYISSSHNTAEKIKTEIQRRR